MAWQKVTGYGRRSLGKTAAGNCKSAIGPKPWTNVVPAQQDEAAIAIAAFQRMIRIAMPASIRVTRRGLGGPSSSAHPAAVRQRPTPILHAIIVDDGKRATKTSDADALKCPWLGRNAFPAGK